MKDQTVGKDTLPEYNNSNDRAELRRLARRHVWMGSIRGDQIDYHGPLVFTHGNGIYLYDIDGKRYIDAMSGAWVVNIGHGRKRMAQAMATQIEQVAYVLHEGYTTPTTIALAKRIAALAGGDLNSVYFSCGGSEAIETALKAAKQYHVCRGSFRHKVICRQLSYHGATYGAMSITGFDDWRWAFAPLVPGAKFAPQPHCYRCSLGLTYPSCKVACVDAIEQTILHEGADTVGAVIAEPVSAASSVSVPPPEYWPRLRAICDRYDILLIADEIVTGFGRTGQLWGLDHWAIKPDILVVGKGIASGYAPLAATIVRQDIADTLDEKGFIHGYTFSGHPAACAAGLENIDIIEEEHLIANAAAQGHYLKEQLASVIGNSPIVGDIRGLGLLLSIEIVADRNTKERFDSELMLGDIAKRYLIEQGVICRTGNQIRLGPPLCITLKEVDELVEVLAHLIHYLERELDGHYRIKKT